MNKMDFVLEYFKALRTEIDHRIKNQSYYTISKILGCAALFGHLLGRNFFPGLVAVPLLAISLDFVIHHNLAIIIDIARYIRDEIEGKFFEGTKSGEWTGYETSVSQTTRAGMRDLLDRFGQMGITLVFLLSSLAIYLTNFDWNASSKGSVIAMLVIWGITIAFFGLDVKVALRTRPSSRKK